VAAVVAFVVAVVAAVVGEQISCFAAGVVVIVVDVPELMWGAVAEAVEQLGTVVVAADWSIDDIDCQVTVMTQACLEGGAVVVEVCNFDAELAGCEESIG